LGDEDLKTIPHNQTQPYQPGSIENHIMRPRLLEQLGQGSLKHIYN
jgi:hypothetical protein